MIYLTNIEQDRILILHQVTLDKDLLAVPEYVEMEKRLYQMMGEEIQRRFS